jgi:hypothetical protein
MVVRCHDIELNLTVRGGLEDTSIDAYLREVQSAEWLHIKTAPRIASKIQEPNPNLFGARSVQFLQGGDNTRLFTGARWTVDQEMGEVAAVCLLACQSSMSRIVNYP